MYDDPIYDDALHSRNNSYCDLKEDDKLGAAGKSFIEKSLKLPMQQAVKVRFASGSASSVSKPSEGYLYILTKPFTKNLYNWPTFFWAIAICLFIASLTFVLLHIERVYIAISAPIASILGLLIFVGFICSRKMLCVFALTVPELAGSQGRYILLSIVTSLLVSGPIESAIGNTGQTATMISCMRELSKNHSQRQLEMEQDAQERFDERVFNALHKLQLMVNQLESEVEPIVKGLNATSRALMRVRGLLDDCEVQTRRAVEICKINVKSRRSICESAFAVGPHKRDVLGFLNSIPGETQRIGRMIEDYLASLPDTLRRALLPKMKNICQIFDLLDNVCQPLSALPAVCEPFHVVLDHGNNSISWLTTVMHTLSTFDRVLDDIADEDVDEDEESSSPAESESHYAESFHVHTIIVRTMTNKHGVMSSILMSLRVFLLLPIFWPFLTSYMFMRSHLCKDNNDNAVEGVETKLARVTCWLILVLQLSFLFMHLMFTLMFFAFDLVLFWMATIPREISRMPTVLSSTEASRSMSTVIPGVHQAMDYVLQHLNSSDHTQARSKLPIPDVCLPDPVQSADLSMFIFVLVMYVLVLVLIIFGACLADPHCRLQAKICDYFFPPSSLA